MRVAPGKIDQIGSESHHNDPKTTLSRANKFRWPYSVGSFARGSDYWDFIRFAFVIGMRIQAPRVQVTSKKMRRVVIVRCIVSVIFNTSILMLAIMIVARYR